MSRQNSYGGSWLGTIIFLCVLVAITFGAVSLRQPITDHYRAWQYEPSSSVAKLETQLGLTKEGLLYFESSRPAVESSRTFNADCQQQRETNNPILGCYVNQSIFVYDVTNKKLDGIEQTTAAHELLHAVYERLSDSEKQTVNSELEAAYKRVKTPELEKRMSYYQKTEPRERLNELHSILGTEFSNLGDTLEAHYASYFTNRDTVVEYYDSYSSVFSSISTKLKALSDKINTLISSINSRISAYGKSVNQFNTDYQALRNKNQAGGYDSQSQLDADQNALQARQDALDRTRRGIMNDISASENFRKQYNDLVAENNELNKSINSSLSPTPSL